LLATISFWQGYSDLIQGHHAQGLRSFEQAYLLWQELAEERPEQRAAWSQVAESPWLMIALMGVTPARRDTQRPLEENRDRLEPLVRADPSNPVLRNRLALSCLLLGELHYENRAQTKALPCWKQAYEHYTILAKRRPDDTLVQLFLGHCCSRLMRNQTTDPYYLEAVALYEQAGPCLAGLVNQYPESHWIRRALLKTLCSLALCHWKAGQTTRAERVFQDQVRLWAGLAGEFPFDPMNDISLVTTLINVSSALREANLREPALPLAREAVRLAEGYTIFPWRDLGLRDWVARSFCSLAALLRHLGEPAEALRAAEQARNLFDHLCGAAPENLGHGARLSAAWAEIGKAHWDLVHPEEALAAFGESARVQRQVFERAPSIQISRYALSRCYDRLAHWHGQCGQRAEVAAALLEREKLWPDDPAELRRVALDFLKLAESIAGGRGPLSPQEEAERQRYLAQSERAKRVAESAARQKEPSR
jgi:tetratricopeptide (TPR) repeat protein